MHEATQLPVDSTLTSGFYIKDYVNCYYRMSPGYASDVSSKPQGIKTRLRKDGFIGTNFESLVT